MSADGLFDVDPAQVRIDTSLDGLSTQQRQTVRQQRALAGGSHPLSRPLGRHISLHPEAAPADDRDAPGRRCGNCLFRAQLTHHAKRHPKCVKPGMPRSHGSATDVKAWWPGCVHHQYESETANG